MAAKDNVLDTLLWAAIARDTSGGAADELDAAAEAGDITIAVDDDTGFTDGMPIRIGSGEEAEFNWISGSPASDVITLGRKLKKGHATGSPVVQQTAYDQGPPLQSGVVHTVSGQETPIPVATQKLPIAVLKGVPTFRINWQGPAFTPHLFAFSVGAHLTRVVGSGTAAAPTSITFDGSEFGEAGNQTYIAQGRTFGGQVRGIEFWGASTVIENLSMVLARGQQTPLPYGAAPSSAVMYETNPYPWTRDSTYSASGNKVWDALSEIGIFAREGTSTTLNGAVNAGATTIVLASGASFANGDWIEISNPAGTQYTQLKDKSTNNFDLTIPVYRGVASGVTIRKVTMVPFAATGPNGVTFGGTVTSEDLLDATKALPIATRIGAATLSFAFSVTDLTPENIARALGVAESAVADGSLAALASNVGLANIDGVYLKGATKDGSTTLAIAAGCQNSLANFTSTWTNQGQAELPMSLTPTSCITLAQWS